MLTKPCSVVLSLLAVVLAAAGGLCWTVTRSPAIYLLAPRSPGSWILYPSPADGAPKRNVELTTEFRRSFVLDKVPSVATVSVCAFKRCAVTLNGRVVGPPAPPEGNWKHSATFEVAGSLRPGTNEVSVTVTNEAGPPALWLSLAAGQFALATDETWEASFVGAVWRPAQLASRPPAIAPGNRLFGGENPLASLRARLPWILCILAFATVLLAGWSRLRGRIEAFLAARWAKAQHGTISGAPASLRANFWLWLSVSLLSLAWALLWCNNIGSLPSAAGFDITAHLDYLDYGLKKHRLPLANEGFQMYQPPLYYVISALLLAIFGTSPHSVSGTVVLRFFGLACGVTTLMLVFLSLRLLFPASPRRQFFGVALAGLLPCNLYIYQFVTNELLATTLAVASVWFSLRLLTNSELSLRQHAGLGLLWGFALLAKTSAIVVPPLGLAALLWNLRCKGVRSVRVWAAYLGVPLLCCLAVCGWHYARVAAHFGNPLTSNVDPQSGFSFWQQQGFRTASFYLPTGEGLRNPFLSAAFSSFPDGVYATLWGDGLWGGEIRFMSRPPWNYEWMAAGYLFALVPSTAVLIGLVVALAEFIRQPRPSGLLVLGGAFGLGTLLLYFSFKVPAYGISKAFYASGALVSLCAFGAGGCDFLSRGARWLRFALYLLLALWAVSAYASFWVRPNAPQTQVLIAQGFSRRERHDLAAQTLSRMLATTPREPRAARSLPLELLQCGQVEAARKVAEQNLSWAEADSDCQLVLGSVLAVQGQFDQAIAQARRAVALAPDHPFAAHALAEWLYAAGRKEDAILACRDALRIRPADGKLHALLANVAADLGYPATAEFHRRLAAALPSE